MKKISIILVIILCMSLAACKYTAVVTESPSETEQATAAQQTETPAPTESATPQVTQTAPPTDTSSPSAVNTDTGVLTFAEAEQVYADPDAFKGRTYASLFQITGDKQDLAGTTAYYARGYVNGASVEAYTLLEFKDTDAPQLSVEDVVYVQGVIEGKGTATSDSKTVDLLWLSVSKIETDAANAALSTKAKKYTFDKGQFAASQGTLSIELLSVDFEADSTTLMTKTADPSVKSNTTYYFDIIVHQGGYFAWYHNCDFWIEPGGAAGFDTIPFPVLDSGKDMRIDFAPYSQEGKLLHEPFSIDVKLGQ